MGNISLPAGQIFIHRLCGVKLLAGREICRQSAVHIVLDAYRNAVKVGKHIELCQCYLGRALHHYAVFGGDHVKTSDAAGTPGSSSVLVSGAAKLLALLAEQLAGKGSRAHAGGIRLHNSQHIVKPASWNTRADGCVGGDGRR